MALYNVTQCLTYFCLAPWEVLAQEVDLSNPAMIVSGFFWFIALLVEESPQ